MHHHHSGFQSIARAQSVCLIGVHVCVGCVHVCVIVCVCVCGGGGGGGVCASINRYPLEGRAATLMHCL